MQPLNLQLPLKPRWETIEILEVVMSGLKVKATFEMGGVNHKLKEVWWFSFATQALRPTMEFIPLLLTQGLKMGMMELIPLLILVLGRDHTMILMLETG